MATALAMLEHGQPYFSDSIRIKQLLIKLYCKLGMTQTTMQVCKSVQVRHDPEPTSLYTQLHDKEKVAAI